MPDEYRDFAAFSVWAALSLRENFKIAGEQFGYSCVVQRKDGWIGIRSISGSLVRDHRTAASLDRNALVRVGNPTLLT